ncbi:HEXXH motif-containing putative peptide modification protein [Streptomyces sp. NPDC005811]|uniref:aKG-HExxH-type peptide beta-hydroxylase n=1 Tax=Streptomyces sp. NPDC005811 TaxID=3154565 RepID=UPI0033E763D5
MTTPEPYRVPPGTLVGIAVGDVRAADVALLDSAERSRLVLALRAILELSPHPEERWPGGAPPTRPAAAWNLLSAAQRADPGAVEAVFHDPAVAAWAFQLVRQLAHGVVPPDGASPYSAATLLGSVAAAAAIRAGTRCSLRVPVRGGRLWLPSLGLTAAVGRGDWALVGIECGPSGTVVYGDSGSLRMPHDLSAPSEGWSPLPALGVAGPHGTPAVLDHLSPHRDFRAVHDPLDLSQDEVRDWRSVLHDTYEMLRTTDPAAYRAVTGAVRSVVPLEDAGGPRVISASVPDAYGAVMTSLSRDIPSMAATFVHEAWHQLLTALGDLTPLFVPLREGPEPVYFAPWRNDPRPLRGLLYGAHAFAGVTVFWLRRRAADGPRADFEFALQRWQVRTALAALGNATGLTAAGGRVVAALAESAAAWWTEPVHGLPAQLAELCCQDASAMWRARNLTVADADVDRLAWLWRVGLAPPVPLPAARLTTAPMTAVSGGARTGMARLRLADPDAFARVRAELAAGAENPLGMTGATAADAALVSGDQEEALSLYRRAAPVADTCVGIGLALGPRGNPLVERPELVLALHTALSRRGEPLPGVEELAGWLGSRRSRPEVRRPAGRCRSWPV